MNKIKNIVTGWWYSVTPFIPQAVKEQAEKRMNICANCPYNLYGVCQLCGCVLIAKTKAPDEHCPQLWWGKMEGVK